jgi:histidinol-phosphate phosphatase family protein
VTARRPVVFLDRDGTLIHDRPGFYLRRPEQVRIYPPVYEALRRLREAGYRLVVISNQSGIGRGFFSRATLAKIHGRLQGRLRRRGAALDAFYFCPHHPDDGCRCRKPSPLLARRAAREMRLDLRRAYMIGDKRVDLDMARALGIPAVLVLTGHGRYEKQAHRRGLKPAREASTLLAAANWILKREAR